MQSDSSITLKIDPDALESTTTSPSSPSDGIIENEKSPSNLDSKDSEDISMNSKKIRKKRTAYHKIDDEIRIKLLEAVHNGETLKSAAKRYRINYSSAKSVLHTYRKEGRIFKKSGQDTPFDPSNMQQNSINFIQGPSINLNQNMFYPMQSLDPSPNNRMIHLQPSPTHGLVDNFMNKLKLESQPAHEEGLRVPQLIPRLGLLQNAQEKTPVNNNIPFPRGVNVSPMSNASIPHLFQSNNPLEKLKYLDNFYMNYSNSPLSNCERMTADTSGSSRRYLKSNPREFDSFSDMVNSLQQAHSFQSEEMYPSQPRLNAAAQMLQEQRLQQQGEDAHWTGKIENAAIDTYKTFMDAQNLLKDALKKASYLNNLMQIQKTQTESPINGQLFNYLSH